MFFGRWSEVTRRLELWIHILEINENGDFVPVEVVPAKDVPTGGIFQLRQVEIFSNVITDDLNTAGQLCKVQLKTLTILLWFKLNMSSALLCLAPLPAHPPYQGQARRIQVDVHSVQDSGTMPLISEIVLAVSVGCVEIRNSTVNQEADEMDSYQVEQFHTVLSTHIFADS